MGSLASKMVLHSGQQRLRSHRLGDVIICTRVKAGDLDTFIALSGQYHNNSMKLTPDRSTYGESIATWQGHIKQHQIRLVSQDSICRPITSLLMFNEVPMRLQKIDHHVRKSDIILNQ